MTTAAHRAADNLRRARRAGAAEWAMVGAAAIVLLLSVAWSGQWPPRALDASVDAGPQ